MPAPRVARLWRVLARVPAVEHVVRVLLQAARRFQRDQCTVAASSLAYQTALALVPLLVVAFALLKATGQLDASGRLLQFLSEQILPSSEDARDEIVQRLAGFTNNMTAGALGGFGLVLTLITGFLLFVSTETIWNRIWCAYQRRTFLHKFLLFYASITLGPFLAAVSLLRTASFFTHIGPAGYVLSLLATPLVFVGLNRAMPVGRVSRQAALFGGLCSALLFELAKYGFGLYLAWATVSYRSVYGALGILPLFLVWIYVAWLTILFGAEVAHAAQRLPALEAAAAHNSDDDTVLVNGPTAARLLFDVVAHFHSGHKALPLDLLRERHSLSEEATRRIVQRLQEHNLVVLADPGGTGTGDAYLPARPAEQIYLDEVLRAFAPPAPSIAAGRASRDKAHREGPPGSAVDDAVDAALQRSGNAGHRRLQQLLDGEAQATQQRLAQVTFADLVHPPAADSRS